MRQWLYANLAVTFTYWVLAYATAAFLAIYGVFPAPFWPSASVALAAALLGGKRVWPGIFLGSFLANWGLFDASLPLAVAVSLTNTLAPATAAALIHRFAHTPVPFFRAQHVAWFVLFGAALHGALAGAGGTLFSLLLGGNALEHSFTTWWRWTLSDAWGTFLFAPSLLLWWNDRHVTLTREEWMESALVVSATLLFALATFFGVQGHIHQFVGLPYLLLAPLMWLTVRFSVRVGATLVSIIGLVGITATIADHGPFLVLGSESPLLDVGLMIVALGTSVLAIGALVAERRTAEVRLWELNETLEQRVAERTVELHRRATEDGLTGVANRTYFMELGDFTLQHAKRTGRPLTALVIDLDRLKEINDTQGHHVGDAAITQLAKVCRSSLRDNDLIGRIGGDEFAVLLSNVDAAGATAVIARMRHKLENPRPSELPIKASIGGAGLTEADANLDDLLRRADAAMYAAKRTAG